MKLPVRGAVFSITANISTEMKSQKQAVTIALSVADKSNKSSSKKK